MAKTPNSKEDLRYDTPKKFRLLLLRMFKGYPSWTYRGLIEQLDLPKAILDDLKDKGIIIHGTAKDDTFGGLITYDHYYLGSAALPIISAWKNEALTEQMTKLTKKMATLTTIIIILTVGILALTFITSILTLKYLPIG